ncbi:MAG: signal peptidase II [Candidatus Binataceae bacterium]
MNETSSAIHSASTGRSRASVAAILLGLITAPILILDQASKLYVAGNMALYETIPVIPNWFDITYTRNPGAAFSMFVSMAPWLRGAMLVGLSVTAIAVLIALIVRSHRIDINSIAFALILAGAAGNLIDRMMRGQVIDFIRVHYYDLNYPVFNIADSAITIGVALVILATLAGSPEHSDESRPEQPAARPHSAAGNSAD